MSNNSIYDTIIALLFKKRKFIILVMIVFMIFGGLIAVLSPKEYVSKTIVLPQIGTGQGLGKKLGGFAKLVGLNLDDNGKNEIFPTLYPVIANSIPFQREILNTPVIDQRKNDTLLLSAYLETIDLKQPNDYVKEYTIGLPGKAIGLFKGKKEAVNYQLPDSTIVSLTKEEKLQIDYLEKHVNVAFNDVEGYIEILAVLPDPIISAQLTKNVQKLLQEYVIEFNISKAKDELEYLLKRHQEAKDNYEEKRRNLGNFRDSNKNYILSVSENRYEQLKTENDLAYNVYSQLANELESAKLKVKRDTPIFTILKPASIPLEPSGPNKLLIIFVYVFLGLLIGTAVVLFRRFWPEVKGKLSQKPIS